MHPKDISILEYSYELPADRIAAYPLDERDESRLLIYRDGAIREDRYRNIAAYIPAGTLLVLNDTRVIRARILFTKPTGATIEIFCLEPSGADSEYSRVMSRQASSQWKCLIGGAGKWKKGPLLKQLGSGYNTIMLEAKLVRKLPEAYVVELSWQPPDLSFAEIIEMAGDTPLPPYIKRKPSGIDSERYQTIYAKNDGSVAAPTAGLHFSPRVFSSLQAKHISVGHVTLHVGAGTFKPVKAAALAGHQMHAEWMDVSISSIQKLLAYTAKGIIAVGTTSLRTIESIYWMGVKALLDPGAGLDSLSILQWEVYEEPLLRSNVEVGEALTALIKLMERNHCDRLIAPTQLLIVPTYKFRLANALITNFHQPQSTLLLLVAAAIGEDWRKLYNYALDNGLRFLSYGDGSLIFLHDAPDP